MNILNAGKNALKRAFPFLHKPQFLKPQPLKSPVGRPDCDYSSRNPVIPVLSEPSEPVTIFSSASPQIAVQAHVFFADLTDEILKSVNLIPYPFDLYISTDTEEKKEKIIRELDGRCHAVNTQVEILPNRGRDVGPFLVQMDPVIGNYKYICHIHTKRSLHTEFGEAWRKYLFKNLFGSSSFLKAVFTAFESDPKLGMIFPETYPLIQEFMAWDHAKDDVEHLLQRCGMSVTLPEIPLFPAGDMFWARTDAVLPLFSLHLKGEDFPEESGQLNVTLAHSIERIWIYLLEGSDYNYKIFQNLIHESVTSENTVHINGSSESDTSLLAQWITELRKTPLPILSKYDYIVFSDNSYIGPFFCPDMKKHEPVWKIRKHHLIFHSKAILKDVYLNGFDALDLLTVPDLVAEEPYLAIRMHVPDSDWLPYETMLLGDPYIKKSSSSLLRTGEKARMKAYMELLGTELEKEYFS